MEVWGKADAEKGRAPTTVHHPLSTGRSARGKAFDRVFSPPPFRGEVGRG